MAGVGGSCLHFPSNFAYFLPTSIPRKTSPHTHIPCCRSPARSPARRSYNLKSKNNVITDDTLASVAERKFFFSNKFNSKTLAVLVGYKHKYKMFIQSIIKLFITKFCIGLFFELQVKMLKFKFRRVKSIKKRIRKRIVRNDKKFKTKIRVNMVD